MGQALGQGGGRNVRDYKPFVIITLFSLCVHSSPHETRKKFKGETEKT